MPTNITLEDVNALEQGSVGTVDPATGLTEGGGASTKSPITVSDLDVISTMAKYNSQDAYLGGGDFGKDPSEFDHRLRYGADNEEVRAQSQSITGMLAKGTGRLISTTLTKFLSGLGYTATALPALFSGDMNVMLDNGWSEAMRQLEDTLKEEYMPIYKTEKFREGNILEQMGTLGFWMDDVVDGAAFMLSALIGSGLVNAAGKGTKVYSNLAAKASQLTRAAKTGKDIGNTAVRLKKLAGIMDLTTMTAFNTINEAAFEAKDIKDQLMESYRNDVELGNMTQEEANLKASEAARTTFWTNAAILMPSNYLSNSLIFKTADRLGLDKVFKAGIQAGKSGAQIAGEITGKMTKKEIAQAFGKDALISMLSEGVYEENMQTALQNYVRDRANKKTKDGLAEGLLANWLDNFGTDEGQKSIALGAIIGLIPGGVGGVRSVQAEKEQRVKEAVARGSVIDAMQNNVQSFYKRHQLRDEETGKIIGETDAIMVDPVTNKPILDEEKIAATFEKAYGNYEDFAFGMQALAAGNTHMFEFLRQKQFAKAAFELLQLEGGAETLDALIDTYAEQEIEDLARAGYNETALAEREQEVYALAQRYRETAQDLADIHTAIYNNHGGIFDFGKDPLDLLFKNGLIGRQYEAAADQLYLRDLVDQYENEAIRESLGKRSKVKGLKGLTDSEVSKEKRQKMVEGAKQALAANEAQLKDLLDLKKQKEEHAKFKQEVAEVDAPVGGKNKAGVAKDYNRRTTIRENGIRVSPTLTTKTLTPEQAEANNFRQDEQRSAVFNEIHGTSNPNYYYKTDTDGTVTHIIRTDGSAEGNIISSNKLYAREITKEDGSKATMTHYFINDELVKSGIRDHETGEFTAINIQKLKKSLGGDAKEANVNQLFYNSLPQVSGASIGSDPRVQEVSETGEVLTPISRIINLGDSTIDQKSLDAHRADIQRELQEDAAKIEEQLKKREKQAREDAAIKNPTADILKRTHGDSRYENTTPEQHFANGVVKYIPAVFQNKPGYLMREGDQVVFVPTVQGEKEYIVSNVTSTDTFEDLGITVLRHTKTDISYETDGRPFPIKIQGKYYKNPYFSDPTKAIEVDENDNPTSVTLKDPYGNTVVITTPHIVHDVAYVIEMKEALKDRIFEMKLFAPYTSAVMVADPKTGVSYGVHRFNGEYVVHKANPGNKPSTRVRGNSKVYERVVKELEKQLDNALGEVSNMNLNADSAEKVIANEFRRYLQNVRAADAGEALSLPDEREVQDAAETTKREVPEEKVISKEPDTTTDQEIVDEQAKEDAKEAEAQARKEAQDAIARQEQSSIDEDKGLNVETVGKDDVTTDKEEIYNGVHDPAQAVSYIDYDKDTNTFRVRNAEFMQHSIKSNLDNAAAYPVIDMDYEDFWKDHPKLKALIQAGKLTEEDIAKLLEPKHPEEFNTWSKRKREGTSVNFNYADVLPIKYKIVIDGKTYDKGIFMHEAGYPHISVPAEILLEDKRNNTNAGELAYRREMQLRNRNARIKLLTHLLKGETLELLPSDKSVGHPNTGDHKSLRDLIKDIDPQRDLRGVTLGAAVSDGTIFIDGNNTEAPGKGSRGNVFWITTDTANGKAYNAKLNPARISPEHAEIVYKALQYASKHGLTAKYPDADVTGGLTNQQVLHFLTVQGKKKTEVGKGNKALSYLRSKRLWTTPKNTIVFGEEEMSLSDSRTKGEFIKWMTSNKNYPMDISKLNTKLDRAFTIGSTMSYDPEVDNYNSFLIKSGTLNTNLEKVPNTKSVMNNPVVSFDTTNFKLIKSAPTTTQTTANEVVTKGKNQPKQPAPETVKPEDKGEPTLDKGREIKKGVLGGTITRVTQLRDGSKVYFFNPTNPNAGNIPLGVVGTVEGKRYLVLTDVHYTGPFESINGFKAVNRVIELTDTKKLQELDKKIGGFKVFLHFDSPGIVPQKAAEVETIKEEPTKEPVQEPTKDIISDEVYNDFIDNGTVDVSILETIADNIISGSTMSPRQQAIHAAFTSRVEDIIKSKAEKIEEKDNLIINDPVQNITVEPETDGKVVLTNGADTYTIATEEVKLFGSVQYKIVVNDGNIDHKNQQALAELNEMLKSRLGTTDDILGKDTDFGWSLEGVDSRIVNLLSDEIEEDTEENDEINSLDDVDDAPFARATYKPFKPIDTHEATNWLNKRFKNLDVEIQEGLIKLGHNRHAFGQSRLDSILLSSAAAYGTEYHEAFHRVSLFLMKDEDRFAIYDKVRAEYNMPNASNKQVEETLAELFRHYVIEKEENRPTSTLGKIAEFFSKIWNYIKTVFVGPGKLTNIEIEELFRRIENGRFRYSTPDLSRIKELEGRYANFEIRDTKFNTIQSDTEYREVLQNLFYMLVESNGLITRKTVDGKRVMTVNYNSPADLSSISYGTFKLAVMENMKKYKKAYEKEKDAGERAVAKRIYDIYREVIDNWGVIYEDMKDFMSSLDISTVREDSDLNEFDQETGENKSEFDQYNKVSFESSAKDNTAATIKLLMSILPESNVRSNLTGMYRFAEFGPTWSKLLIDNLGVVTPSDMMLKLEAKSKSHLPYQILLRFLNSNPNLKAQFFTTVKQSRLDFINAYFRKSKDSFDLFFGDAVVRSATKSNIKDWNTTFNRNPDLFVQTKGQAVKPNVKAWKELQEDFNLLRDSVKKEMENRGELKNFVNMSNRLKDILSKMGITLTDDQFDYILLQSDPNQDAALLKLMQNHLRYIFSPEGTVSRLFDPSGSRQKLEKKITFANAFTNEKGISYLAEMAAQSDPLSLGDTTLGPAGKLYYLVTQHTYLTNEIDRLKKDPKSEAAKKLKAVYNQNSVYLREMLQNPVIMQQFSLKTLSSVVREGTRDVGREYRKVTDLEEYIIRMAANFRGYVTPPTPGDRGSYQYFKGFPTMKLAFDTSFNWNNMEGSLDIIGTFVGYLNDEINRVKHTKKQVDDAINGDFDWKQLVENLHFIIPKTTHRGQKIEEGEVWIDNGKVKKTGKLTSASAKLLKTKRGYTGNGTRLTNFAGIEKFQGTKEEMVTEILNNRLRDEIEKVHEMGIIARNSEGTYYNVLIPDSIISAMADRTGINNNQLNTMNAIADNMVNTMMANIEMGKVFTSDPAAFANQDDYVKRLTGYTSTGTNLYTEFPTGYYKNDQLILSPTYNVTTFKSYVMRSKYYEELVDVHTKWNLRAGIAKTEAEAKAIAEDKLKSLKFVDQTDAQTFITPEMYRALSIKLGEWSDQKEEAYQLLTDNEFDFEGMDETNVIAAYQAVMQPLKTTYMKTNQNHGQSYSVFDKMSMSTLFRPMVKGTQLEDLLDRMESKGKYKGETPIHHVKFHTAEKAGRRDIRDFWTDETETEINLANLSTYSQEFDYLRKQLVTDPHDVRTIMFGSQAKKIGISNVQLDAVLDKDGNVIIDNEYKNVFDTDEVFTGRELVKEVHTMLSELSHIGVEKFKKDFRLGDDYSIIDKVTLAERMKDEARKANLPQYVIDSFKVDPVTKDFYVDFDSIPGARKWIQTRIVSLIKKATIDVNLPGNSFIQMSNIGLRKLDKSDDLRFIEKEGLIEAAVSVNLFKHVIPGFKKKSHKERVKFLKQHPELTAMAYRVPTQGQNSTYILRIVKFLPEQVGDTVILPAEGTAIGGFDFDIDKLYIVRHNYRAGKKIKYLTKANSTPESRMYLKAEEELADEIRKKKATLLAIRNKAMVEKYMDLTDDEFEIEFERVKQDARDAVNTEIGGMINDWIEANKKEFESWPMAKQNTEQAVQNRLLDLYHSVWQNEKHNAHRTQPLGYGASKLQQLADTITDLTKTGDPVGKPLATLTPSFQLNIKSKFKFGAEGLGPNALANVHQILGQYVGLGLHSYLGIGNSVQVGEQPAPDLTFEEFTTKFLENEQNLYNVRISLGNKERQAARKNILEGKKTRQAEILLETLKNFFEKGSIEFVTGSGVGTAYHGQPIAEYLNIPTKPLKAGKRVTDFSALLGQDNEYITEWFSALIDANVDIAADPYISKLNSNPFTNDVITLLIRSGVGGIETFNFIAQPALKAAARLADNKDNKLDVETGKPLEKIKLEYLKHYIALSGIAEPTIPKGREAIRRLFENPENFTKSFKQFGDKTMDENYYFHQLMVLEAFQYFRRPATKLKEAILSSRVDTKKIGNTLIGMLAYEARSKKAYQDDLDQSGIRNYIKLYDNTYLGALTENSIGIAKPAIGSLLMEGKPAFRFLHANILDLIGKRFESDEKLIGKVADEIYVNVAATFFAEKLKVDNKTVSMLLRGDESIPKRIYDIRRKDSNHPLKNNALIKMLSPIFEQDRPDFLYHNKPDDKWHKDSIVRAWKDLLTGEGIRRLMPDGATTTEIDTAKAESKKLGRDLFYYAYLTSGFKTGVFSFFDYIPRELLVDIGYDRFIKQMKKDMDNPAELDWMMDEIFLNNWQDSDFVPQLGTAVIDQSIKDDTVLKLKSSLLDDFYYGENKHGEPLYRPYVKTGTGDEVRLYRYGGFAKKSGDPIYYEVHKKSYYNQGYVLRENMFDVTGFSSNKIKSKNEDILKLLEDPYEVIMNLGIPVTAVEDLIPAKYSQYKDEMPSEATVSEYDINPLKAEGVSEELERQISNTIGNLVTSKSIPSNFYTLENGNIVFIENLGQDEIGYVYDVEHYFNRRPSREAIKKRKNEC